MIKCALYKKFTRLGQIKSLSVFKTFLTLLSPKLISIVFFLKVQCRALKVYYKVNNGLRRCSTSVDMFYI